MNVFLAWLCALTLFLHSATSNTSGTHPDGCTNIFVTNTLQSVQGNAMSYCQSQGTGGSLAIIKDASTANFIHDRINSGSPYWIGATYNVNNQWIWNDGTIIGPPGYENWTPGTPSDSSIKRCLVIEKPSDGALSPWYNVACNNAQSLPFICQVAVSAAVLCDPCTHRKKCTVTGCTYKCGSCVKGYYGEDCRYLNTTFVESNQQSIKKNNSLNLEFSCTFSGFPLPNITWIFNGNEINTDDVNYDITTTKNRELDEIQQSLTIYQPRCIENLMCRAHQNNSNIVERTFSISLDQWFTIIKNVTVTSPRCKQGRIVMKWQVDDRIPKTIQENITFKISTFLANNKNKLISETIVSYDVGNISIYGLMSRTNYTLHIAAYISNSCSEQNETINAMTSDSQPPLSPTNTKVTTSKLTSTCIVSWDKATGTQFEELESFTITAIGKPVGRNFPGYKALFLHRVEEKNEQKTFNKTLKLFPNTNYTFEISATSCGGESPTISVNGYCLIPDTESFKTSFDGILPGGENIQIHITKNTKRNEQKSVQIEYRRIRDATGRNSLQTSGKGDKERK